MSYNYVDNYAFDRTGTRIRPAWKGLGLFTGVPSATDFSTQTGIPLDIAKTFLEKVWTNSPDLQATVEEMFNKYIPDDKKLAISDWLIKSGTQLPPGISAILLQKGTTPTAEAGGADVVTTTVEKPESKMKLLIPIALVGVAAFLIMRKR